jgi:hypothetical protein
MDLSSLERGSVVRTVLEGLGFVAHDCGLVATDHCVGGEATTVAIAFNGLAEPAAEGNLVPVQRTLDRRVAAEGGAFSLAAWSKQ